MKKITKAVITAAGLGTRLLPATKAQAKELLPIVDKPIIQYVVEEAVSAGITDIIIITGRHENALKEHFGHVEDLEKKLKADGKEEKLKEVQHLAEMANFTFIKQTGPYGNGTPILCASEAIGDEPFLVLWGDDFVVAEPSRAKQLIDAFEKYQAPILTAIRTDKPEDADRYGFVAGEDLPSTGSGSDEEGIVKIEKLIEKPGPENKPSDLATVSGYVLVPEILKILKNTPTGKNNELWLMDALAEYKKNNPIYACEIKNGKYYDAGNVLDYLKANVELTLQREDLKEDFKKFITNISES